MRERISLKFQRQTFRPTSNRSYFGGVKKEDIHVTVSSIEYVQKRGCAALYGLRACTRACARALSLFLSLTRYRKVRRDDVTSIVYESRSHARLQTAVTRRSTTTMTTTRTTTRMKKTTGARATTRIVKHAYLV